MQDSISCRDVAGAIIYVFVLNCVRFCRKDGRMEANLILNLIREVEL